MNDDFQKWFESIMYRPIDPFLMKHFKDMNDEVRKNKIINFSEEAKNGMKLFRNKKIIITGLIYNSESQIQYITEWFNIVKSLCYECHIVIVENNSKDNTRKFCELWRNSDPEHVHLVCNSLQCDGNWQVINDKSPFSNRIKKMAFLRNKYVEYISKNFKEMDYVFVIDFDLKGTLFWDGIFHSIFQFYSNPSINVIACNGIVAGSLLYYDSFAYAKDKSELRWNSTFDKQNHDQDVLQNISQHYQNSLEMDKVMSAFGGFCIYKFVDFIDKYYGYEEKRFACEHCIYHEQYDNVQLNPKMIFIIEENLT
jgi:hypothetical protein